MRVWKCSKPFIYAILGKATWNLNLKCSSCLQGWFFCYFPDDLGNSWEMQVLKCPFPNFFMLHFPIQVLKKVLKPLILLGFLDFQKINIFLKKIKGNHIFCLIIYINTDFCSLFLPQKKNLFHSLQISFTSHRLFIYRLKNCFNAPCLPTTDITALDKRYKGNNFFFTIILWLITYYYFGTFTSSMCQ